LIKKEKFSKCQSLAVVTLFFGTHLVCYKPVTIKNHRFFEEMTENKKGSIHPQKPSSL
jgi:hypothetical protein